MKLKTSFKIIIASSILLPALIVGGVGSYSFASFYTEMVSEEASAAAYSEAKSQTVFFERYSSRLSSMAQLDQIKRAVSGDYAHIKEEVDAIIDGQGDGNLLDIIVMDSGGIVVANSQNDLSITESQFTGYNDQMTATESDGIYISSVSFSGDNKYSNNVIYIVKPVETASGSKGYIAAAVNANSLATSLSGCSFFNNNGSLMFLDGNNNVLNVNGTIQRSGETSVHISRDKLGSSSDITRYVSYNSDGYYRTVGMIENTDWIWVGNCSVSSVSFKIMPAILNGLIILAICIVIDSILAFGIYRRAISPLARITEAMEAINAGDRDKRLPHFKTYEHQVISETFNDLLDDFYISEDIHKTVSALSDSMLFEWDVENKKMYISDNFKNMFELDTENCDLFDGSFIDSLMSEKDARHFQKDMKSLLEDREYAEGEYLVKTLRNTEIWINIRAHSYTNRTGLGEVSRILGVITDINNKKKSSLQLSQKASYDFLSQLYNRSTFLKELQKLLDMKRVNENYAVLFIDVDDFKFINDRYGHNVGDEVIKYVADTIKNCVGNGGIAGRFGGDEFVLCVTDAEKVRVCDEFAAGIIDDLYKGYKCQTVGITLNVKASIGISIADDQINEAEKLVGEADEAMYFVKKNGKANFHFYDPSGAPNLDLGNTIT